jgi:hypothetical protein
MVQSKPWAQNQFMAQNQLLAHTYPISGIKPIYGKNSKTNLWQISKNQFMAKIQKPITGT